MTGTGCYACEMNALSPGGLPLRESVYDDGAWRVAHAFDSSLPGWFVVVSRRHVTSMSALTVEEAASLGPLLVATCRTVERVLEVPKAYLAFFAEGEGFAHLHVHVIPRRADLPKEKRGPGIFGYLGGRSERDSEVENICRAVGAGISIELNALCPSRSTDHHV